MIECSSGRKRVSGTPWVTEVIKHLNPAVWLRLRLEFSNDFGQPAAWAKARLNHNKAVGLYHGSSYASALL